MILGPSSDDVLHASVVGRHSLSINLVLGERRDIVEDQGVRVSLLVQLMLGAVRGDRSYKLGAGIIKFGSSSEQFSLLIVLECVSHIKAPVILI